MLAEAFIRSGKVRDLYRLSDGRLVLVATDRISAFDVILPTTIPEKGRVLTGLSRFWFAETSGIVPNHLRATDPSGIAADAAIGSIDDWRGRVMICQPATVVPIEAVVRGYLAGSGWKEYRASGSVCGVRLPAGLREGDRLPEPIFTPATKADQGEHDENIDFDSMVAHVARSIPTAGGEAFGTHVAGAVAERIRETSIALYRYAAAIAERVGILVADTKFEFGLDAGTGRDPDRALATTWSTRSDDADAWPRPEERLLLIDEALTPDSSRFWDAATYEPGRSQVSFDKQFVRDWLETQAWDKTAPGPALPDEVVAGTRARYVEAYERITGASFERYLTEDVIAS